MKGRNPIFSFNGGEISRRMEGRSDLDGVYDRAVAFMLNYVPAVEGPAMKRPGFRYIRDAMTTAAWLSRFVFNTTQAYVIEWGDLLLRFYTNGGRIEDGAGVPYELAVPYTAEEAPRVSVKQSYDRLYLAHPNHPPAMLTRVDAEQFVYSEIPLKDGPFKDFNTDKTKTVTISGAGEVGDIATVTADIPLFQAGHVGAPFIFEVEGFSSVPAWEPFRKTDTLVVGNLRRSDGKVYELVSIGGSAYTGSIEPTHTSGTEWDGSQQIIQGSETDKSGVQWKYRYDRFGVGVIQAVTSATIATVKVTRAFPVGITTYHWAHACFSKVEGWPQLVDVWGQRLVFWKGVDFAGSVTGDYFNFSPVDKSGIFAPDMGFRRRLDLADPPMWSFADKEYMLAGTASGEVVVGQINTAAGLSSDNLRADPQSSYGSREAWPVSVGTGVLFVQRGGRKIREGVFSYQQARFVGANINIYARQITRSGVNWLAFQQEPEEILWGGRGDGLLIAHPHSPEQAVKGFARVQLAADGVALSGVTIPSDDGSSDDLWILAELGDQKCIMKLADWWDEDAGLERADAVFVDYCVSYDGTQLDDAGVPLGLRQTFDVGLAHLNGRTVRVLADGIEYNDLVVVAGVLNLPKPAMKVVVGLGYKARIRLLRPEIRGVGQTTQGLRKRIARMIGRLIDSGPLAMLNSRGEKDWFFERPNSLKMDTAPPLYNGDTSNIPVGLGSDFSDAGEILSDDASPSIISLLIPTYELEELKQ
jgi:hypothetical protein